MLAASTNILKRSRVYTTSHTFNILSIQCDINFASVQSLKSAVYIIFIYNCFLFSFLFCIQVKQLFHFVTYWLLYHFSIVIFFQYLSRISFFLSGNIYVFFNQNCEFFLLGKYIFVQDLTYFTLGVNLSCKLILSVEQINFCITGIDIGLTYFTLGGNWYNFFNLHCIMLE